VLRPVLIDASPTGHSDDVSTTQSGPRRTKRDATPLLARFGDANYTETKRPVRRVSDSLRKLPTELRPDSYRCANNVAVQENSCRSVTIFLLSGKYIVGDRDSIQHDAVSPARRRLTDPGKVRVIREIMRAVRFRRDSRKP
jgi:hypothetical protein